MGHRVGIDWGGVRHAVCVVDEAQGTIAARFEVAHTAAGLAELERRLAKFGPPSALPVAIERPSGLLVETLVEAGHPVVPIHPNVVKASRPRYRAAGGKSDQSDSYLLGDLLRTDGHRFRPLQPCSGEIKALRTLVRGRTVYCEGEITAPPGYGEFLSSQDEHRLEPFPGQIPEMAR